MTQITIPQKKWAEVFTRLYDEYPNSIPVSLEKHFKARLLDKANPQDPFVTIEFKNPELKTTFLLKYI